MPKLIANMRTRLIIAATALGLLAVLWVFLRPAQADLNRIYRIGYGNDAPMHFRGPDGTPSGLAVELVQRAAAKRGVKLEWVVGSTFNPEHMDLWVLFTVRPDRLKSIHFSEPYLQTENCFIVLADSPYFQLSDLKNARISHNSLFVVEDALAKLLPGAKRLATDGNLAAIEALRKGEVEVAFVDEYNAVRDALHGQAHPPYRILPIRSPKRYMAIASSFANAAVADEIRRTMQELSDAGELDDLINRWTFFASPITDTIGELAAAKHREQWLLLELVALSTITVLAIALAIYSRMQTTRLHRAERFLHEIADSVPGIVFQFRLNTDGTSCFPYMSEALNRIYGLDPESVRLSAEPFFAAAHPEDRESIRAALDNSARMLTPWLTEYRVCPANGGAVRWLTVNAVPHRESGGTTLWHGVILEVTERKQAEASLKLIERKLHDAQKLESLGLLAGRIAHDFNNLLTAMLGNTTLASTELPADSPLHPFLESTRQGCLRAADLCKQLLAYSGKSRFVVRKVSMNALIEESQQLFRVSLSRQCEINLKLAPGLPPIEADETQIHQVIMNLVINAAQAVGQNQGLVTVSTSLLTVPSVPSSIAGSNSELRPGDYICFEVTDNGCGMSAETRARIFEPFFTTKPTGHGLGLAAVHGIVRSHNGRLTVTSEIGRGTTFRLLFPAASGAAEPLPQPGAAPANWQGKGCILLVDDEESVRRTTAAILKKLGFSVVTAADGREGLDIFQSTPDRFALVLMDLSMPRLDGRQAFLEMVRIRENVRVILMSGFKQEDATPVLSASRLAGFLQKPYSYESLREMLRHVTATPRT